MASAIFEQVKRSLPGWSLARDKPRPKQKQGWECPAPTVEDWEDYKKWKEQQGVKDELPPATQIYLADTSLLFYQDPDVQLPWIHRIKVELPRRVGRLSGDLPVKASFIAFASDDADELYEEFKKAMAMIGVVLCRHIHNPANRFEIAHLEQSDLIMVQGGDRRRLWDTLGTDLSSNVVAEHVKWRYLQGAVVIAVGEAMTLLSEKSWYVSKTGDKESVIPYTGWKIFPHIVVPEDIDTDCEDLVESLGGAGVVILGLSSGGGMIFNRDGLVEPIRHMIQEYRWDWQSESVKQAVLLGPPRGTGLICPLYAAMKEQEGDDPDEDMDVWSYALTQEEEHDEERLIEQFDVHNTWLDPVSRAEVESLKQQGNEAFKAGKADLAGLHYEKARVQLESTARSWSDLSEEIQKSLDALEVPKKKPQLPSEKKAAAAQKDAGQKEDHRGTALLLSLLLNLCACHLLAHEQDEARKKATDTGDAAVREATSADSADANATDSVLTTTLVEVRDNLVSAFRAANEALALSGGRSAKAWYRRGCVFEQMRDPRNAHRDFEHALQCSPGDKAIAKRRDVAKEAASAIPENMYYARHKEMDAQEQQLKLDSRRALLLRGSYGDAFVDERCQFSVAQPLARLIEGKLEEIDGKPQLVVDDETEGDPEINRVKENAVYLHPHALWAWEFMVQRAPNLQLLEMEDVDLGSGPLEWLCKGLRTHSEIKVLRLTGCHLGPSGAKMMRNVIAQNASLIDIGLDDCALHDLGLDEIAEGLRGSTGPLEVLSLRRNHLSARKLGKLAGVLIEENTISLAELDLSGNPLGIGGIKDIARILGSSAHRLRVLRLQDALVDIAGFWRLVNNLDDGRPLSQLDLRCNPIGRGTRRIWRSTMGPTIRCDVLLSDHPLKVRKEALLKDAESDKKWYPLPRRWV